MAAKKLLAGQVKAGDALPELGVDVSATTVILGALATRDWRPMHHDKDFAQNRNGVRDVFMNTPNQAAWFERYVPTDRPSGRSAACVSAARPGSDDNGVQGTVLSCPRRTTDARGGHRR